MRDPARIEPMLNLIRTAWELNPDMRLGQLLVNIVRPTQSCPEVFYVEDDELVRRIGKYFDIHQR
jgi:uncharacterized protein YihD (DUF1040 family)